jgi:hypothetical protein
LHCGTQDTLQGRTVTRTTQRLRQHKQYNRQHSEPTRKESTPDVTLCATTSSRHVPHPATSVLLRSSTASSSADKSSPASPPRRQTCPCAASSRIAPWLRWVGVGDEKYTASSMQFNRKCKQDGSIRHLVHASDSTFGQFQCDSRLRHWCC